LFRFAKEPILRCNIGAFAEQNRLFCNAKQGVLKSADSQVLRRLI